VAAPTTERRRIWVRADPRPEGEWDAYVERFHAGRAGATEALLGRSVDDTERAG